MNTKNILGGILGSFEEDNFERETSLFSTIAQGAGEVFEVITGVESKSETRETSKFSKGSIEFNHAVRKEVSVEEKKKTETDRKKIFFQALKEDQDRAEKAKDKLLFEEEINDIITNLPTERKNQLLHYQASYQDRSIYQRAELRKKLIEEQKKAEKQEKEASIPSPAKQPSALEGAFEGRSGNQGGGQANLSFQAVG
ncbi:MAG: hypothetical protein Q7R82_01005 [Candidatus Daviesbacteria bacterium]|nr:hypothetical protein [Candidatus Daviesbacteria bacterium]